MNRSDIFGPAMAITLRHRTLWVMGLLVSLGGMGLSLFGGGGTPRRRPGQLPNTFNTPIDPPLIQLWERYADQPEMQTVLISIVCVGVFAALVVFLLSIAARGGLIGGIELAREKGSVTIGEAWAIGMRCYGRMLAARLMLYAPILVGGLILFCLAIPSILIPFMMLLCLLPLFCILQVFMLFASVASALAERGIAMDDLGPADAYRQAVSLLRNNTAKVIAPLAILLFAKLIFGFAALALLAIGIVPAFVALGADTINWPLLAGTAAAFVCLFPLTALLNGVVTTWDFASWNLLYRQLTGPRPAAMASPY